MKTRFAISLVFLNFCFPLSNGLSQAEDGRLLAKSIAIEIEELVFGTNNDSDVVNLHAMLVGLAERARVTGIVGGDFVEWKDLPPSDLQGVWSSLDKGQLADIAKEKISPHLLRDLTRVAGEVVELLRRYHPERSYSLDRYILAPVQLLWPETMANLQVCTTMWEWYRDCSPAIKMLVKYLKNFRSGEATSELRQLGNQIELRLQDVTKYWTTSPNHRDFRLKRILAQLGESYALAKIVEEGNLPASLPSRIYGAIAGTDRLALDFLWQVSKATIDSSGKLEEHHAIDLFRRFREWMVQSCIEASPYKGEDFHQACGSILFKLDFGESWSQNLFRNPAYLLMLSNLVRLNLEIDAAPQLQFDASKNASRGFYARLVDLMERLFSLVAPLNLNRQQVIYDRIKPMLIGFKSSRSLSIQLEANVENLEDSVAHLPRMTGERYQLLLRRSRYTATNICGFLFEQ